MRRIAGGGSGISAVIIAFMVTEIAAPKPTTIEGRIIAYRKVERVIQVASFIPNRELFLFQVESTKNRNKSTIIKIDYTHFGYTDITEEMLQRAVLLRLKAHRTESCDQSYAEFISTAPAVREETSGSVLLGGITFVEKFEGMELDPHLVLKCYTLQEGDFEVVEPQKH